MTDQTVKIINKTKTKKKKTRKIRSNYSDREGDNSVRIIKLRIKQRFGYNIIEQLFIGQRKIFISGQSAVVCQLSIIQFSGCITMKKDVGQWLECYHHHIYLPVPKNPFLGFPALVFSLTGGWTGLDCFSRPFTSWFAFDTFVRGFWGTGSGFFACTGGLFATFFGALFGLGNFGWIFATLLLFAGLLGQHWKGS